MFPFRLFPAAVLPLLFFGCASAHDDREPTADELHELSLEELLEIPIETVRSVREEAQLAPSPAQVANAGSAAAARRCRRSA
jgi:hypothetical protein